jgi:hypothetical protein
VANPSEFSLLCRDRDQAAYGVVGAATVAVAFLNLEENQKALNALLHALADYRQAAEAIEKFHQSQTYKQSHSQSAAKEAA